MTEQGTSQSNNETRPLDELLSPESKAGFEAVLELEDRQSEMRSRADLEAVHAASAEKNLAVAREALSRAEADAIVNPGEDSEASANAASARVSDLDSQRAKHARASKVLGEEVEKIEAELKLLRADVFDRVEDDLLALGKSCEDEVREILGDIVPALRRRALVINTCARLHGGLKAVSNIAVSKEIRPIQDLLSVAGAGADSWKNPDAEVEAIRAVAACVVPDPRGVPDEWVDEDRRAVLRSRRAAAEQADRDALEARREAVDKAERDRLSRFAAGATPSANHSEGPAAA